jgi:hypothetical protein
MKNTLWIFGDSLATGYNSFVPNSLYPKEIWWSHQLAEKLGMECINTAGSGNDRFQILTKWLTNWNDIKEGDIVIYQIGFKDRYNLQPLNINALDLPYELMKDKTYVSFADFKKIKYDIAITGEISFDGLVTEIGGLDLKVLGAIKAGVKEILFPLENMKDYNSFLEKYANTQLIEGIKFHPVNSIEEVFNLVFDE